MSARRLVSIVVPVLDEEDNVERLVTEVRAVLAKVADRYEHEFVFTDNHSGDRTFEILERLAADDPRIRVFRFSKNFGFQRSILTGFLNARGDAVVEIDCDLQDPPELILEFLAAWEAGAKMVYGVRRTRDEGLLMRATRRIFYRLIDLLSEERLPLDAGDFRLVDRALVEELRRIDDATPYLRGALALMGFEQRGVPYDRRARAAGRSKFTLRALVALAVDGILAHSVVPLRLATYTGLAVSVVTFGMVVYYIIARFLVGRDWPAGFATITILVLASLSLNALFLGLIGEYLGRIYRQVRRRPLTIVERKIDRP